MIVSRLVTNRISNFWMISALVLILLLPLIIGFALCQKAGPLLNSESLGNLLFSSEWSPAEGQFGFRSFIISSVYVTVLAFILSAPLCLFAGIYLTQYASGKLVKLMRPVIDILAGLPSVIYGVWGVLIIVPFISNKLSPLFNIESPGYSILAGGIVLALMCIPYMLNMLLEVFQSIPTGLKEACLSLGANKWETVKHAILKKALPGIISSFGLGIAKAFGETLAVMMVVGNRVLPTINPFNPGYPLPALIANNYGEMLSIPMYDSALMFAALILLVVILAINLLFRFFIYRYKED